MDNEAPDLFNKILPVSLFLIFIGFFGYFVDLQALLDQTWLRHVKAEEQCEIHCGNPSGSPIFLFLAGTGIFGFLVCLPELLRRLRK